MQLFYLACSRHQRATVRRRRGGEGGHASAPTVLDSTNETLFLSCLDLRARGGEYFSLLPVPHRLPVATCLFSSRWLWRCTSYRPGDLIFGKPPQSMISNIAPKQVRVRARTHTHGTWGLVALGWPRNFWTFVPFSLCLPPWTIGCAL